MAPENNFNYRGCVENFKKRINRYRDLIDRGLSQIAPQPYPALFYEPVRYILRSQGKRIRPILVLLSCQAVGGGIDKCLNAALAIELLHNFTLVHDDIMDQDDLRRGRVTVHKKWDEATAILAGDGLVALAYEYLLKTESDKIQEISQIFTSGIIDLCEGQAFDKEFESRDDIRLDQYLDMIEKKTARLLMISADIGAIIGDGSDAERKILREYSKQLGCAFQIQDDLLDIETTSGKTFGSDIQQKKKTILLVHALNYADQKIKNSIVKIFNKNQISHDDILKIRDLFRASGTISFAEKEVETRINEAQQYLNQLGDSEAKEDLKKMLTLILNRKS